MLEIKPSPDPDNKSLYLHLEDDTIHATVELNKQGMSRLKEDLIEINQAINFLEEVNYHNS